MNRQKRETLSQTRQGQSADREQPSSGKQKQQRPDQSSGKQQQQQQAGKQPQQQGSNASQGGFANWEHKQHLDE
jgi:hypothetical protein